MKKILALTLISALMAGCGGGSSGGSNDSDVNKPDNGNSNGNETGTPSGEATVLEGTWNKPCGLVPDSGHYDIITHTYTGNQFHTSIENYTDANCTTLFPEGGNPTASGYFTLGDKVVTGSGVTATEEDSHITEYDGVPFDLHEYTIFLIDNDTLYYGDGEAEAPEQRPTQLDYNRAYYRVN